MKKALCLILSLFAFLSAFAQAPVDATPEKGDFRASIGWGWSFGMNFDGTDGHTRPIIPLNIRADYTFLTFADGQGSIAAGALFEFCHYQTWFTRDTYSNGNVKTTHTWTNGILAAEATARYCLWQDFEAYGRVFLGANLQLGYTEEYSDESYANIVPHTNGPGNSGAFGLIVGLDHFVSEHMIIGIEAGLGCYTTLGFSLGYKF